MNQYTYLSEFLQSMRGEIIDPLKNFTNTQNSLGQKLNDEMKVNEKNFKASIEKTEKVYWGINKLKKNYHSLAKNAEEIKVKLDSAKANGSTSSEHRNKLSVKYDSAYNEQKEAELAYTHQLSYTNNLRNNYIEVVKNILNEFQIIEENYIDFMKDTLRKYNFYQVPLFRNIQYDNERKKKVHR